MTAEIPRRKEMRREKGFAVPRRLEDLRATDLAAIAFFEPLIVCRRWRGNSKRRSVRRPKLARLSRAAIRASAVRLFISASHLGPLETATLCFLLDR